MAAMRVLLAEDDETKAVQTQSMLREAEDTEVVVDWVSSATEALATRRAAATTPISST